MKKIIGLLSVILCISTSLFSTYPPIDIPENLRDAFTLQGRIPVDHQYHDDRCTDTLFYPTELFESNIQKAKKRESFFGITDTHLYRALDDLSSTLQGKEVAIIGSRLAWYESIVLAYDGKPVVIDSNPIQTNDPRVTYMTSEQYLSNPRPFDLILSITNTPHEGLGRYGDAIDPNGDMKAMAFYKQMLTSNGQLLLAVPVGPDKLIWNAERVYGETRLKMLFEGWRIIRYYGFTSEHVFYGINYRPVFLLKNKQKETILRKP